MSFSVHSSLVRSVARVLDASDFDLAAGLREDEFNNFLFNHYENQSPGGVPGGVYAGSGSLDELGLTYKFTIDAPIAITLSPLSSAQFTTIIQSWIQAVPEIALLGPPPRDLPPHTSGSFSDPPPPNVQLKAPKITLTVAASDGSIQPVALPFSMTATGFVAAATSGGDVRVSVVPQTVRLDNPGRVRSDLARILRDAGHKVNGPPNPDCIPLIQLILHIANAVIAPKLSSFVKEFDFPVPIKLFNNVVITSVDLQVQDKLVVIFAKLAIQGASSDSLLSLNDSMSPEDIKLEKERLLHIAESQFKRQVQDPNNHAVTESIESVTGFPDRGLFLLMHQRFFQILANAFLAVSKGQQGGGNFGPFFYSYNWSVRTWAPVATISGSALLLAVNCEGRAGASVGIHTHCGDISAGLGATADALPASFSANFFFQNNSRELWTSLAPQPFTLSWSISGLPWPLSAAVELLLHLFTDLGIAFIAALGLRWNIKLTSFPPFFPGTGLKYSLRLDQKVVMEPSTGALMVAGLVAFLPD